MGMCDMVRCEVSLPDGSEARGLFQLKSLGCGLASLPLPLPLPDDCFSYIPASLGSRRPSVTPQT
jgi:hypothetical protein